MLNTLGGGGKVLRYLVPRAQNMWCKTLVIPSSINDTVIVFGIPLGVGLIIFLIFRYLLDRVI